MSGNARSFLSAVLAYVVTRVAFALLRFQPTRDLEPLAGYAVDITIWIVAFVSMYWLIGVAAPKKEAWNGRNGGGQTD